MSTVAVVLAAGLGTRMKSALPKVLHPILGDPSLLWVLRSLPSDLRSALVVVHHGQEQVMAALETWAAAGLLPCPVEAVPQGEPLGTGHAVKACTAALDRLQAERVLILSGDVPLLPASTVTELASSQGLLLAMELERPTGYGRILTDNRGHLTGLVEEKDATPEQREIRLVNGGAYSLPWKPLRAALQALRNDNAQKEYYLTDAVVAVAAAGPVAIAVRPEAELLGMNSRLDQAHLQGLAAKAIREFWMREGVTFLLPESALVGPRVQLARDVVVEPGVRLEGEVTVGEGSRLGQGSVIADSRIGNRTELRPYSILEKAVVGSGAHVGPFARLREGTDLADQVHIGNFVETKKAAFGLGAKANHLAYVGDAEVGEGTNIGAGVITCNYDGVNKHKTTIGKRVFVGSDTQLVAPVTLGDDALIAAGSTVTRDVPAGALALSRVPQDNKEGAATRLRARQKKA
ncbi:MAG TPA: bifunctional UDP-N-acetylglucosamine diphosphorylase/glucosamine-1-phosphate N-acetyltransferase GlmU [Holophagaceae bacterium]|nr:bifunctional UDP-N-acetylglucosamine diphosphorylase/glucosamine-1-phosphate N-acetyltransferase GlmU [Holophagaceae bacterium]